MVFVFSSMIQESYAQKGHITGIVANEFTKEPIRFASVYFKKAGYGTTSDSVGKFSLAKSSYKADTLVIKYVGYEAYYKPASLFSDTAWIYCYLKDAAPTEGVIVKSKFSKGLRWWRAIVAHKPKNNPYRFENYSYELYNKLELDLNNINKVKFMHSKMMQPFSFLLNNIDSVSETKPFLPVFLTESLSDYYYSNKPYRVREEIKAVETNGIKNESLLQFMGGISQKINIYEDYVKLFDKAFISPISSIGDKYYHYKGADTQYINHEQFFHLFFNPLQEGTNTFTGDCWVHSKTWAIEKINITASSSASINFVNRLTVVQEFAPLNDSTWMFFKDKLIADLSPFPKEKLSFIGRKTATYKNILINTPSIQTALAKNKKSEEAIVSPTAKENTRAFWQQNRHENLNGNEVKVYQMIDTLKQMPLFKTYTTRLKFLVDGYKQFGMIEIGPWYKWISYDQLEHRRFRFDLGTTPLFNQHLRLYGYLAYGVRDKRFKEKLGFNYKVNKHETWSIAGAYTNDLDNGRIRFNDNDEATIDNFFSRFIRRKGITQKFINIESYKVSVNKDWENNLSTKLSFSRSNYKTYAPLPSSKLFANGDLVNSELGLHLRYAPGERKISGKRKDFTIKGKLPVLELNYAMALPHVFQCGYTYQKYTAMFSQNSNIPRWGTVSYAAYGGKINGSHIPFMLLEVHPGNEIYYYSKQSFNLMNRFEYVSDKYYGFNIEHNFDKKLFNLFPFMRKTSMRQFWNVKTVWGNMSMDNRAFNRLEFGSYRLKTLRGKNYTEVGTGIDNIFKCFRVDLVWRFAPHFSGPSTPIPTPDPSAPKAITNKVMNFGVFGSFRLQF
ncbi:DUF5686 family protein [Parasediminibacterium sp. JCM 36343]|uniref:DUF5686 family protein n=1 Tax=Parasediminibacterium sp. JCM 36343 TaxID=3374279 RepID=UPI00397D7D59